MCLLPLNLSSFRFLLKTLDSSGFVIDFARANEEGLRPQTMGSDLLRKSMRIFVRDPGQRPNFSRSFSEIKNDC
jgi:hypothetical protein